MTSPIISCPNFTSARPIIVNQAHRPRGTSRKAARHHRELLRLCFNRHVSRPSSWKSFACSHAFPHSSSTWRGGRTSVPSLAQPRLACLRRHSNVIPQGHARLAPNAVRRSRHRIVTPTLRGVQSSLFGSQPRLNYLRISPIRAGRGANFDGDHLIAAKKGLKPLGSDQPLG